MSGHSKWSTIKRKKGAADAKRGKIFSKIAKEIMIAARESGGDPDANITLRSLIQKAKSVNMPSDNIDRAIKKGTGDLEGEHYDEMVYEGYASGGVAMVVEALTDNKNRTAAEVRHAFTKAGASLAGQGSATRMFQRKGHIVVDASSTDEVELLEMVLEAGAEDMSNDGEQFEIVTDPSVFMDVVDALEKNEVKIENSEVTLLPDETVPVTDPAQAKQLLNFIEALEDLDDVQSVHANFDIDDEILSDMEE